MVRLSDWPIRRKLRLMTITGIVVALVLACLAFVINEREYTYDVEEIAVAEF